MAIKNYAKGSAVQVAKNFKAREFDCQGNGCCKQTPIDEKLVDFLQKIRDHFGKPVYLTAYRCPIHNARTPNAAPNSRHTYGQAADFHINGVAPEEIAKYAESIGVNGIGLYDTFVHIDTRDTKSFWYSHAQHYRATFGGSPVENEYSLEQFIRDVQGVTGSNVDGKAGPETIGNTVTISSRVNRTHPVVKFVQKRLYALGYTKVGNDDGIAGAMFEEAMKAFQHDNGCTEDGEATAKNKTWRKLLGMG